MIEAPDVDAAKAVLVEWLDAWLIRDWRRMARLTNSAGKGMDANRLSAYFQGRSITQHTEPKFKDGNVDSTFHTEPVGFADFDVSVDLADGRGTESFDVRVIGIDDKWGVNAVSTMKRTTSPPGKGQQWQRRSQKAKHSAV